MRALAEKPLATNLLERAWYGDAPAPLAPLAPLLRVASWGFHGGSRLRNRLYDAGTLPVCRLDVPVISVGNLVVGGAGKTPAVIALAQRLVARGKRVAVISRGYGGHPTQSCVSDGERIMQTPRECGDEPWLTARRVPGACVMVGASRAEVAREALQRLRAQVLILDDGFQHRALARDEDILVLGGTAPMGNGLTLPAGPLREPVDNARRATVAWLCNGAERASLSDSIPARRICSVHRATDIVDGTLDISLGVNALRGCRVLILAGIARPAQFASTVAGLGAEVVGAVVFRDHHSYTVRDLHHLDEEASRCGASAIVTTEKDAARLDSKQVRTPVRAVRIEAQITQGEEILGEILDRC